MTELICSGLLEYKSQLISNCELTLNLCEDIGTLFEMAPDDEYALDVRHNLYVAEHALQHIKDICELIGKPQSVKRFFNVSSDGDVVEVSEENYTGPDPNNLPDFTTNL